MAKVSLVYAGYDYWDRSRPLIDGRLQPEGIDLDYVVMPPIQSIFSPGLHGIEASLASYVAMRASGDDRFLGVPVFTSRRFVHGYVFIRSDAGIEVPQDLAGKRVGIPHYQSTPIVWMRGTLQHDYGVPATAIHWFQGNVDIRAASIAPRRGSNRPNIRLPSEIRLTVVSDDRFLDDMLVAGELDALMTVQRPASFLAGNPRVRRLFPNYHEVEKNYYQRTGILPNMHVLLLRREVYQEHPWIARVLLAAFEGAKTMTRGRLEDTGNVAVPFPWLLSYLEETVQFFGNDPFPYGLQPNRKSIETMVQYLVEQRLAPRQIAAEELFTPETLV